MTIRVDVKRERVARRAGGDAAIIKALRDEGAPLVVATDYARYLGVERATAAARMTGGDLAILAEQGVPARYSAIANHYVSRWVDGWVRLYTIATLYDAGVPEGYLSICGESGVKPTDAMRYWREGIPAEFVRSAVLDTQEASWT